MWVFFLINQRMLSRSFSFLLRVFLVAVMFYTTGCSFEKELPVVCVSEGKKKIAELCREYKKRGLDEESKNEALLTYGFNKRDARSIYSETEEESVGCRVAIVKQCDLIMLRNGVGY